MSHSLSRPAIFSFFPAFFAFALAAALALFTPVALADTANCPELLGYEKGSWEEDILVIAPGIEFSCDQKHPWSEDKPTCPVDEVGLPISMLTGSKILSQTDVAISSEDGVPLAVTRSYQGHLRMRLPASYSVQDESIGLPWVTARDERVEFDTEVPDYYSDEGYGFPMQIRVLDAGGNMSYFYPSSVAGSDYPFGDVHVVGGAQRFVFFLSSYYCATSYDPGPPNEICDWSEVYYSDIDGDPVASFSEAEASLPAPFTISYRSRNPRRSGEKIELDGFEYVARTDLNFCFPNGVQETCSSGGLPQCPPITCVHVYELQRNTALAGDIVWTSQDGSLQRVYDKTSKYLKSVELVRQGLTIEHFPGITVNANGKTYEVAQRIGDGASSWEDRRILYRDYTDNGTKFQVWAVSWEDSSSATQVRDVAVWRTENGQLVQVDYPDANVSAGYGYGSYRESGGLLVKDNGDAPDNLPAGTGYSIVTGQAPLAEISSGPLGGPLNPLIRYRNWAAFDLTGASSEPGILPRRYGGVARETWVRRYQSATQTTPIVWKKLYEYDFEGGARTADPYRNTAGSYDYGRMDVNKVWKAGMPQGDWIHYVRDLRTNSIHSIDYPDIPLDYLGANLSSAANSVRDAEVLDAMLVREYPPAGSPGGAPLNHMRLSVYGLAEEIPLAPFDGLAESLTAKPFLEAGPDATNWTPSAGLHFPPHKLARLTETGLYGTSLLERVERVTDRYGNKVEYTRESSGTYAGDLIGTEFYPAQLSGGQTTYPSTPPVASSATFDTSTGWRLPTEIVSLVGSRTYTTEIHYDSAFPTKPDWVKRWFGPATTGDLDSHVTYAYDGYGRPTVVTDIITGASTEIEYLRDSPFSSVPKWVERTDPAARVDKLTYTYYDETTTAGSDYSFFSPLLERVELNNNERQINYDSYDDLGRVLEISDDFGRGVEYHRSPDGQVHQVDTTRTGETPRSIEYLYDPYGYGRAIETTDQNGKVSKRHYDAFGRLAATENPKGEVMVRLYDPFVRARASDVNNDPTYNGTLDLLKDGSCGCSQTSGGRLYRTIRFEPLGQGEDWNTSTLATLNARAIEIWDYYYDSGGSVGYAQMFESMADATASPIVPARTLIALRDSLGQLEYMIDDGLGIGNGAFSYERNAFSHDNPFALAAEVSPDGFRREYEYDLRGRLEATVNELGIRSTIERDSTYHWTTAAESPLAGRTEFLRGDGTTTPWGFMEKIARGNGTTTHYEYDSLERQSAIAHKFDSTSPNFMRASYLRDAATWNRTNETVHYHTTGPSLYGVDTDYTYDAFDALDSYDMQPLGGSGLSASQTYTVDPGHNITVAGGFDSLFNDFNQLYSKEINGIGQQDTLEYDARGNLSSWDRPTTGGQDSDYEFEYDALNHLESVTYHIPFGGYETVSYKVDSMGRLAHRDSTLDGQDGRRFFSSGLEPSVTLLDREPTHEYYEEFSASGALDAWDEPGIPGHDSTWSYASSKARATVDNGDEGVLLWPPSFDQGSGLDFTLRTTMDLSSLVTSGQASRSGRGGLVFGYAQAGAVHSYYRLAAWWDGPTLGVDKLRLELEEVSAEVIGREGETQVTLTALGADDETMATPPGELHLRARVFQNGSGIDVVADTSLDGETWTQSFSGTIANATLDPGDRAGLYAGDGDDYVWFDGAGFERAWADPDPKWHNAPQTASWNAFSSATVTQGSSSTGPVSGWVTASSASTGAGVWWDGNNPSTLGHHADPARSVLGLLLRREANSSGSMRIQLLADTSEGQRWIYYDTAASSYSANSTTITIPLKGDLDEAGPDSGWQLVALDPRRDLRLATWDAGADPTHASLGRIRQVRVLGNHFSVGGLWAWERMPERLYTGASGEWTLARWAYDEAVEHSTPYYEIRHRHLHRNARLDVTGFSPLDPANQDTEVRQYSPYGRLLAKGTGDEASGMSVSAASFPAAGGTWDRADMMGLGLTGKPYDPETGLYYFGHRWYSPELRRWTQAEPLGLDGPNLYHFNFNDPVNKVDLDGLRVVILYGNKELYVNGVLSTEVWKTIPTEFQDDYADIIRALARLKRRTNSGSYLSEMECSDENFYIVLNRAEVNEKRDPDSIESNEFYRNYQHTDSQGKNIISLDPKKDSISPLFPFERSVLHELVHARRDYLGLARNRYDASALTPGTFRHDYTFEAVYFDVKWLKQDGSSHIRRYSYFQEREETAVMNFIDRNFADEAGWEKRNGIYPYFKGQIINSQRVVETTRLTPWHAQNSNINIIHLVSDE